MIGQGIFPPQKFGYVRVKCTQSSTNAPVMGTPVDNTLCKTADLPVFARTGAGVYTLTKTGMFTAGKTFAKAVSSNAGARVVQVVYTSADVITFNWFDAATPSAADSGDFDLELAVYDV